ncbi:bifunctional diguanylate cyclase/phosphodiesterase [Sulfurovum riftiae]|uniref:Diguanylate cyclase n=1 Tax=Sulfurovum riftiae TaxID=1630136 RepID=A0A151CE46_9BACT|nr:EAL domain-containing protein [Sulfurovum riftiae]KYJ85759.1 hypothetical protein AS592_03195 [Sulfurovum riftiae]
MKTLNTFYTNKSTLRKFLKSHQVEDNPRLLVQIFTSFTQKEAIEKMVEKITSLLPQASIIGTTTDGAICEGKVTMETHVIALTQFEHTDLEMAFVEGEGISSYNIGQKMASELRDLRGKLLITFSDGLFTNGEDYLNGIHSINDRVVVAGGMAADSARFKNTFVFDKEHVTSNGAVGVLLVNENLSVYRDYSFNWLPIGKEMTITKVENNRIYTIDDMTAYKVYEKYLGEEVAKQLPAVGVEFPLIIQKEGEMLARAILSTHDDGSLSFAGDFKEGDIVTFGYGDVEMILNQSIKTEQKIVNHPVESIFIYSCMARRRFMPDLIENEIAPFQNIANVTGFFTYGEFYSFSDKPELLNQTMTIVGISESAEIHLKPVLRKPAKLNEYQKSIKALAHLLNVITLEATEDLKELEEKTRIIAAQQDTLDRIQDIGHFGSWEVDLKTNKSVWSKQSYRIYKLDPETTQPTLDTFLDRVIDEDKEIAYKGMGELQNGHIKSITLRVRRSDGEIITLLINAKMVFENGEPSKIVGTTLDITEQVRLKQQNRELADMIDKSSSEILIVELKTYRILYANYAALQKLGYTQDELYSLTILDINRAVSLEEFRGFKKRVQQIGSVLNRTVYTKKDGTKYPVQTYAEFGKYHNKEVAIIFNIDITHLIEIEKKQIQQARILEQIHDAVISTDLKGKIIHWNHGATEMLGYTSHEMIGKTMDVLYTTDDLKKAQWIKRQTLLSGSFQDQIQNITKSGNLIYTDVSASLLKDDNYKIIGITYYAQDITQKKEIEQRLLEQTERLNFQAHHDPLTRLPNRMLFNDRLHQSIAYAHRHHEKFAVFFIDLDNFKQINDTLGHHYGDEILKIVAQRLFECIREGDTLARLGGDEFTIIAQDLNSPESAANIAQKIIDAVKKKIVIDEHTLHVTVSIGISLYPKDSTHENNLLKYADSAMYQAKSNGRNNYQFYSTEMTNLALEKAAMELELHRAIEEKQLLVYYQPQIDARSESVVGVEALVRWKHPSRGMVMPNSFIRLAEDTGLIKEVDNYVMRQAMTDMAEWYANGMNPGKLSLNLSLNQLMKKNFFSILEETLAETGFDVEWLVFEITESQMMLNPNKSIEKLNRLNRMGIEISIDDFGTGYSSLAYLKRLPVDKLKIDKSFIYDLPDNEEDRAITDAVIALATSLKLEIIAEGVEHEAQVEYLLSKGCHIIQGFHYSKAITADALVEFIGR